MTTTHAAAPTLEWVAMLFEAAPNPPMGWRQFASDDEALFEIGILGPAVRGAFLAKRTEKPGHYRIVKAVDVEDDGLEVRDVEGPPVNLEWRGEAETNTDQETTS